jgi:hypothetical protein
MQGFEKIGYGLDYWVDENHREEDPKGYEAFLETAESHVGTLLGYLDDHNFGAVENQREWLGCYLSLMTETKDFAEAFSHPGYTT